MKGEITALATVVALTTGAGAIAFAGDDWGKFQVEDRRSGYTYAAAETRVMQDDDFENPGMLWVEHGEEAWNKVDGEAGKSCNSCHGDAAATMKTVGSTYPVFAKDIGKLENVENRINRCRTDNMKAEAWKYDSQDMLGMVSYVKRQSFGQPLDIKIDGEAAPWFEKGKAFYNQRRGQLDMACSNCHVDNAGNMIRANILSQGQGNGFPTYRLKWQKPGSLHRRFRGCNKQVRATPYKTGSDEYLALELYVMWRGRGLPVETPAVRN
jgi:sulfur-oxidizing protein SoxA